MWKELHMGLYGHCLPLLEKLASGPLYLFLEISDESTEAKYTDFATFPSLPCLFCWWKESSSNKGHSSLDMSSSAMEQGLVLFLFFLNFLKTFLLEFLKGFKLAFKLHIWEREFRVHLTNVVLQLCKKKLQIYFAKITKNTGFCCFMWSYKLMNSGYTGGCR